MRTGFVRRFSDMILRFRRPDTVHIAGDGTWHTDGFRMAACGGRDQVARLAAESGWAAFERPMPHYFAQAVKAAGSGLVIDVGANTGFYSLVALAVSGDVSVVAYEPLRMVRGLLRTNIRLNEGFRRIRVLPYAASDVDGRRTLFIPDDGHGLIETSASLSAGFKTDIAHEEVIAVTTLDRMHRGGSRVVPRVAPRVAVLKIDAEGHDIQVLRGAERLLLRDRPIVFVEVLLGADEAGLTEILNRCRYRDIVLYPDGASEAGNAVTHQPLAWNHMWVPIEA